MLLTLDEKLHILQLQLLIARAAQEDSLKWWDDKSLTPYGREVIQKHVFQHAPDLAVRRLALAAALARHNAVLADERLARHLFWLDPKGEVALELSQIAIDDVPVPDEAITSAAQLRDRLMSIVGNPLPAVTLGEERGMRRRQLSVKDVAKMPPTQLAGMLACAYMVNSDAGIFPYAT